jgi:hypothetical protein
MQTPLPHQISEAPHRKVRWGFGTLAVLMLSLGIGATTAAFSVIDTMLPHADAYPDYDTAVAYTIDATVDDAGGAADIVVALTLGTAALALLVACADSARALHERSGHALASSGAARAAFTTGGALTVAALLVREMSSSSLADVLGTVSAARLDLRAVAFAIAVFAIVEARRRIQPRLT